MVLLLFRVLPVLLSVHTHSSENHYSIVFYYRRCSRMYVAELLSGNGRADETQRNATNGQIID